MNNRLPAMSRSAGTASSLQLFRLRLLKLLLLCGSAAIGVLWFFEARTSHLSPIDRYAYPLLIFIFSIVYMLLLVRPDRLERLEQLSFGVFAIYMVLYTQPILLVRMSPYTLTSVIQWFPLVYTAAFFFLRTRQALFVSVLIYLAVLLPYGIDFTLYNSALWASERGMLLLNTFCAHPVYIVTLSGIATLKNQIVQARAHADVLHIAASVDYLTGVANRRAAADQLHASLERAQAEATVLSVMLLDIDHFKRINDSFGHDIGDQVLIEVAALLQGQLRATDTLGRWGGEEFLIVATATEQAETAQLAERLRELIGLRVFPQVGQISASFGIATARPRETPAALVKRADEALYRAKQAGRDRVEIATVVVKSGAADPHLSRTSRTAG